MNTEKWKLGKDQSSGGKRHPIDSVNRGSGGKEMQTFRYTFVAFKTDTHKDPITFHKRNIHCLKTAGIIKIMSLTEQWLQCSIITQN